MIALVFERSLCWRRSFVKSYSSALQHVNGVSSSSEILAMIRLSESVPFDKYVNRRIATSKGDEAFMISPTRPMCSGRNYPWRSRRSQSILADPG